VGRLEKCTLPYLKLKIGSVLASYSSTIWELVGHLRTLFGKCGKRPSCLYLSTFVDSNREDFDPAPVKSKFDSLDFDTLLKQAQKNLRR
jgi:hypothetical protein